MESILNSLPTGIQLRTVMDTVLDGLIIIDMHGNIKAFNASAIKIFGYEIHEVLDQNVKMLMPNPYATEHNNYLNNYLTTQIPKVIGIGREVSGRRKNGEIFPMELGVSSMEINGQPMFVGTVRDISERKEAEEEIKNYIAALKQSNQELDDFAYIASHDLKEPLRGLSHNAQFLKDDYGDVIQTDGLKRIARMVYLCERMERLVNDLLHFSRLGNQNLAIMSVDLHQVIKDVLSLMENIIIEKNVKILIPKKMPHITCDVVRITEMFRNLITNAIKYNDKPEKIVKIGYKKYANNTKDNPTIFYVQDNGIGIPKNFHEEIFRIFKRLNDEDDAVKGTGVGLTFVKKIIERHGGHIWIESQVGKGTTFYFTIEGK